MSKIKKTLTTLLTGMTLAASSVNAADTSISSTIQSRDTLPSGFHSSEGVYTNNVLKISKTLENGDVISGLVVAGFDIENSNLNKLNFQAGYSTKVKIGDLDTTLNLDSMYFTTPNNAGEFNETFATLTFNDLKFTPSIIVGVNTNSGFFGEFGAQTNGNISEELDYSIIAGIGYSKSGIDYLKLNTSISKEIFEGFKIKAGVFAAHDLKKDLDLTARIGFSKSF